MVINYQCLGNRIREQRKQRKISQIDFAEMIDRSTAFVSRMERGLKKPSLETLMLISAVLNTTPNALLIDSLPNGLCDDGDLNSCTPFEQFFLTQSRHALLQILRDGEQFRNQTT